MCKSNKPGLAISACLCGENCRYDGNNNRIENLAALGEKFTLVPVCPEVLGGLSTPRSPSEIRYGRVVMKSGTDVTEAFCDGAKKALNIAKNHACNLALLKAKSPSCGKGKIYDGCFSKKLIDGNGVCAELFLKNGICIYTENEIDELLAQIEVEK